MKVIYRKIEMSSGNYETSYRLTNFQIFMIAKAPPKTTVKRKIILKKATIKTKSNANRKYKIHNSKINEYLTKGEACLVKYQLKKESPGLFSDRY